MDNLLKNRARAAGILLAGSLLAMAQVNTANPPQGRFAQPGTINYIEGQVKLDGQSIAQRDVGAAMVEQGHLLQTGAGKAEMLLTPGVFVRLAPNSTVKMISSSLSDTRVQLAQGQSMMEVAEIEKENHIQVTVPGANVTVEKRGIYEFSANPPMARVFDGKAVVAMNDRTKELFKGDQLALDAANAKLKSHGFDVKQTEVSDDLYAWSKLRADYTAQANMSAASSFAYAGSGPGWGYGQGWYGSGWYWDPYFDEYAFLLGDGFLWDPFGFGFFSPGYWGAYAPYFGYGRYGYGYGRGFGYGHGFTGRTGGAITRASAAGAAIRSGGFGGMRGGMGGFHGGGFAGGGFHGGGFGGGGFHGGGGGGRR